MRFIAIIFSIYISALAVSPALCGIGMVLKLDTCCNDKSNGKCSEKQTSENQQSNKTKDQKPCSPYCYVQNCNCFFIPFNILNLKPVAILADAEKARAKNDTFFPDYTNDCWQPPELKV